MVEQLKNEIKDRERDNNNLETKHEYQKQQWTKEERQLNEKVLALENSNDKTEKSLSERELEVQRLKDELAILKAQVIEADKNRDYL